MGIFLTLAFLFCVGSIIGWGIEVVFRRFFSAKKWINPGYLTGPYLPLYGSSLCILYLMAELEIFISIDNIYIKKLILFALMALAITFIEYIAGLIFIKKMKIKLWDYSDRKGNIQGIICPLFSFFWAVLSAFYYFLIHPHILNAVHWLSENLAFSFGIGFFYGIFVIDFVYSTNIMIKIKNFAKEKEIIVHLEEFREDIRLLKEKHLNQKPNFIFSLHTGKPVSENLLHYFDNHFRLENGNLKHIIENIKKK